MIEASELARYIAERGPWLYHATATALVEPILKEGLRPGDEVGRLNASADFHATRPGHVYLWTLEQRETFAKNVGEATLKVDLRCLEPSRVDPDEDLVQASFLGTSVPDGSNEHWVPSDPPYWSPDWAGGTGRCDPRL